MELVLVLAIISVLLMVAMPAVAHLQRQLKSTEMEAAARQIYIATQNRLTVMKSAGTLDATNPLRNSSLISDGKLTWIADKPSDYGDSPWVEGETLCYAAKQPGNDTLPSQAFINAMLLPIGAIDHAISKGYYVIEYNPSEGAVYGVFYAEEGFTYEEISAYRSSASLRETFDSPIIGYYGGFGINTPTINELDPEESDFSIINNEKLFIKINPSFEKIYTLTIEAREDSEDLFATYAYTFSGNAPTNGNATGFNKTNIYTEVDANTGISYLIILLDSLEAGSHFLEIFPKPIDKLAIVPGSDIKISLSTNDVGAPLTIKTTNSLFASRTNNEVIITHGRHLQNLEPTLSGVVGITSAKLANKIDWKEKYPVARFTSITNSELKMFNGNGNLLSNFSFAANGSYCGLFGSFGGTSDSRATLSNVRLSDSQILNTPSNYIGMLAGYIYYTDISECSTFLENTGSVSNGTLTAASGNKAMGAGGLVGSSHHNKYTKCFSALNKITVGLTGAPGTSGVGGFVGISDADTLIYCYANTTEMNVTTTASGYAGGFAGRSSSAASYSYALGNINQTGGTAATGFWYAFGGSASNCYSATMFAGSNTANTYGFSNMASTNCSYYSGSAPTYTTLIGGITARDLAGLQLFYSGDDWRTKPNATNTYPYDASLLVKTYSISRVSTLPHYGNWPTGPVGDPVYMAYYEIYLNTTNTTYSIGFYNDAIGLATLQEPTTALKIIQDGYVVLFNTNSGLLPANLISETYVKLTWQLNGANTNSTNKNLMKEPKDIRYNAISLENLVRYNGIAINGTSQLNLAAGNYYYRFLSNDHVVQGDSARDAFYQSMKIDLYANGSTKSGSYTYYYTPHFAKSKIILSASNPGKNIAEPIFIRTMRQYTTLSLSDMSAYWNKGYLFKLENDINFGNNSYTSNYFGTAITRYKDPQPIGNTSTAFKGTFDGNDHTINKVDILSSSPGTDLGLFGKTQDASIRNFIANNITVTGPTASNVYSIGGLVGSATKTTITQVSVDNVTVMNSGASGTANTGGFAGLVTNSTITNCDVRMSKLFNQSTDPLQIGDTSTTDTNLANYVRAAGHAGGFAGKITGASSDINHCFAAIGVSTISNQAHKSSLGGFVGALDVGTISNCYASGNVRLHINDNGVLNSVIGGFVGETLTSYSDRGNLRIRNCYSTGTVRHMVIYVAGGFVGNEGGGMIENSYTTSPNSGISSASWRVFRRGFSGRRNIDAHIPSIFAYTNSGANILFCATQEGSPGSHAFSVGELSQAERLNSLPDLIAKLHSLKNSSFSEFEFGTVTAHPYKGSLGNDYPYPGLVGVGRGITDAQHFGNWTGDSVDKIQIGTTGIYRPNVPIPDGKIMVFKDEQYIFKTPAEVLVSSLNVDSIILGGSLYVPESAGILTVSSNQNINWTVGGDIIVEPNITISKYTKVSILSQNGDIVMNEITLNGGSGNLYEVNITASNGTIEAKGSKISVSNGPGKLSLVAKAGIDISGEGTILKSDGNDGINVQSASGNINAGGATIESTGGSSKINLTTQGDGDIDIIGAKLKSAGNNGISIQSTSGNIKAEGATVESTQGGPNANITIQSSASINLDLSKVTSLNTVTIIGDGGVNAKSASITNAEWDKTITITSSNSTINLSSLPSPALATIVSSGQGNINITAKEDISILSAKITALHEQMKLKFKATGSGLKPFMVQGAILQGNPITAQNLAIQGSPSSGTITFLP